MEGHFVRGERSGEWRFWSPDSHTARTVNYSPTAGAPPASLP
jgi:hypothetical protein